MHLWKPLMSLCLIASLTACGDKDTGELEDLDGDGVTTTDGDYPVIIRTTSPTIALPTDSADSNLKVVDDKLK